MAQKFRLYIKGYPRFIGKSFYIKFFANEAWRLLSAACLSIVSGSYSPKSTMGTIRRQCGHWQAAVRLSGKPSKNALLPLSYRTYGGQDTYKVQKRFPDHCRENESSQLPFEKQEHQPESATLISSIN